MKNRRILSFPAGMLPVFLLTGELLIMPCSAAVDSLSVEDALKMALSYSPSVKSASRLVNAAAATIGEQRAGYFPCISATGIYTRLDPVSKFTPVGQAAPIPIFPVNNYDAHATVLQTFSFGRTGAAVTQAKSAERSSRLNRTVLIQQQSYTIIRRYYSLRYFQDLLCEINEQTTALTEQMRETENREQAGVATQYDVLTARVHTTALETRRIQTQSQVHDAAVALSELLGTIVPDTVHLQCGPVITPAAQPVDSLIARALRNNPAMRLTGEQATGARASLHLSQRNRWPIVTAGVNAGWKNGYLPNVNTLQPNWSINTLITVPLFCGLKNYYAERAAHEQELAAWERIRDEALQLGITVSQAVIDLNGAIEIVNASEPRIAQALSALTIARVKFNAGVVTELNVLDAYSQVAAAKIDRLKARYQALQNFLTLKEALGEKP